MRLRKTRFVCVSDTHGYTPSEAGFKLPAGDVLIHAGDLTNRGSLSELRKTIEWISKADYEVKIVVCVRLTRADGPKTIFKVFGSPYSQFTGDWAFGYESADAAALWGQIPLDADIVITHTPPHSHCDSLSTGEPVGCKALRQTLSKVRPLLAVCGHVHEARGYERVKWSSPLSTNAGPEQTEHQVMRGVLPPRESKKQNLVDLSGKEAERLDNDGYSVQANPDLPTASFTPSQNALLLPSITASTATMPDSPQQRQNIPFSLRSSSIEDTRSGEIHLRRKETCIVNAAIVASKWPHRGGKRFNSPIVVDLELPTWTEPE
ncbi:metallophosphatase domain-containing protein [Aspergillus novofumigatus IBT 16806]|uniref:Ser/Thr protein phosphatase family protein n=1 Tax=Aspergillus novofumigatus (strain IBT 16806) TaxID=1392255 RepID=A0A2I1CAL9_ASPN1|nr:Ser/Thr protein phosphatase family protein [Aspergillus novofumigatus IBT 16806]PKX94674.1 Ser/Thr protein phosphatase family protein [Aspergillus novofumigatus IBT 16806]